MSSKPAKPPSRNGRTPPLTGAALAAGADEVLADLLGADHEQLVMLARVIGRQRHLPLESVRDLLREYLRTLAVEYSRPTLLVN